VSGLPFTRIGQYTEIYKAIHVRHSGHLAFRKFGILSTWHSGRLAFVILGIRYWGRFSILGILHIQRACVRHSGLYPPVVKCRC